MSHSRLYNYTVDPNAFIPPKHHICGYRASPYMRPLPPFLAGSDSHGSLRSFAIISTDCLDQEEEDSLTNNSLHQYMPSTTAVSCSLHPLVLRTGTYHFIEACRTRKLTTTI